MAPFEWVPPTPESFKDERFEKARADFPVGSLVYLNATRQIGVVEEVRPSPDGPRLKIKHIGSVPVGELRPATETEIRAWENR
jgi:hypothetical protein